MAFKAQVIQSRIIFTLSIFGLLWLVLFARSSYLQLIPNKKLSKLQDKQFERTITLQPRRGNIYDRNNKELAISIPSKSLFADPQKVKEPYFSAKKLSQLLDLDRKVLLKRLLNKKRRFVWIKRHLTEKEIQTIKSWRLEGLHFLKERKRFYSNENSLSQTLGFTGWEGKGLEGIEKQYEEFLRGESQKLLIQKDAKGRYLFRDFSPFITKVSGYDVHLTIDSDLQFYLETALKKGIKNSQAKSAMGVVLSAESSEILALANIPDYNPNHVKKSQVKHRRNRVITDAFEPGSTLKVFTIISALKKGIPLSKLYPTHEGRLEVGSHFITEADPKKKFKEFLNMSEILSYSSNVGASLIAQDIGARALRKTLKDFGFGEKTGIDFPGEAKGVLRKLPWRKIETSTVSFGHGISATTLQIANAYAAIANGGMLNRPFLVKKIRNSYTGEEQVFKPQNIRPILTKKSAHTLSLMLTAVTEENGTGVLAKVPGYFVAGKTGTAQKVDFENEGGYKKGEYISSFAGFIPAQDPKFVIYIVVDGAKENFYASTLTAPLFAEVASYSVRQANLSPTILKEENILLASRDTASNLSLDTKRDIASDDSSNKELQEMTMPNLKGMSLRGALKELKDYEIRLKIKGSGYLVESQPRKGERLSKNQNILLIFN